MFAYSGYVLHQAERSKTAGELRAEDAHMGELAAAISASWATLTARLAAPRRWRAPIQERVALARNRS